MVHRPPDVRAGPADGTSAAACSTSRPSRRWPSTSNATCARRWSASRRRRAQQGVEFHEPTIAIRTGDTPPAERARFARQPADILITTPESIYLLLTSNAREMLRSIETVVVDEIHALVPTKRGSHLALSLERLEAPLRPQAAAHRTLRHAAAAGRSRALPRRRRSQRPTRRKKERAADAARARFSASSNPPPPRRVYRPVTIVDASAPKQLDLRIEVPLDDMTRLDEIVTLPSGPASQGPDASLDLERDSSQAAGTGARAHARR